MEVLLAIIILILDQATKIWAAKVLAAKPLVLIPGALELTYLENRGAVWGLMQGWRIVFLIATVGFLWALLWFYRERRQDMTKLSLIILALLFSGAVGNLIDRVLLGYVRDMIYFSLINFPVFNVADSAITIAAGLLILETLFLRKRTTTFDLVEQCFPKKEKKTEKAEDE